MSELFLHIGTGKTGSTALQRFLYNNRIQLYNAGYNYPLEGLKNIAHVNISAGFNCGPDTFRIDKDELTTILKLISRDSKYVILSSEYFANSKDPSLILNLLLDFFDKITIICYFRRHDLWFESLYNQFVKKRRPIDWGEGFESFIKHRTKEGAAPLNYKEVAKLWDSKNSRITFIPKPYEKESMEEGDIRYDFIREIGLDSEKLDFSEAAASNVSISTKYIELVDKINRSKVNDKVAQSLINQISRLPKDQQKFFIQTDQERQDIIKSNLNDYKWLALKYNSLEESFFKNLEVEKSYKDRFSMDDPLIQMLNLSSLGKLKIKKKDTSIADLKLLVESKKIAIIPIGFRCYTKQFIKQKFGVNQESLPFDSGFFTPDSIASVLNDPVIDLDYTDPSSYAVCIKQEKFSDEANGLGISFKSSNFEDLNKAIEVTVGGINKYLDATLGYYTLDTKHKYVLAHYNWHEKASFEKSKGVYDPAINLKNISDMMNRRIKRLFELCESVEQNIFIFYESQDYQYMMLDKEVFSFNNLSELREVVKRRFGEKSMVVNAKDVDTPTKLLRYIYPK